MQTYLIEVRETLSKTIEVVATSSNDAIDKARAQYEAQEVVLDASDFDGDTEYYDQTDNVFTN